MPPDPTSSSGNRAASNAKERAGKPSTRKVAVVGGGWAGFAAAVELTQQGHAVTLFEASRTLGGRARRVEANGIILDNGQHILLGAYKEILRLMRAVGINPDEVLLRLPLQMRYPPDSGGMNFATPRLPAPLHMLVGLWRATGLAREDKMALARFSTSARWIDWQLDNDCSASELLDRFDQPDRLIQLMWRPLCIAALNTPPERASAQVFLNVLRDSLGARRAASDMLIPKVDLTALFPQRAAAYIEAHGGTVKCGATVWTIRRTADSPAAPAGWVLELGQETDANASDTCFDAVVVATQPGQAANLLGDVCDMSSVSALCYEPITTCYLQYQASLRLANPFFALIDSPADENWGQFVFDRGWLDSRQAGLLAVVVSASHDAIAGGHEHLAAAVANQLAGVFRQPGLSRPEWSKVITEKRATFSCTPALPRPGNATSQVGLALAGDYTEGEYPATLESAARSGVLAARSI